VAGCDTPGVYFVLCREIYPNLGCSAKVSISRSYLSPSSKLLMNVSPNLELFDLRSSQIWSLLKTFISRSKGKFESCDVIRTMSESAFSSEISIVSTSNYFYANQLVIFMSPFISIYQASSKDFLKFETNAHIKREILYMLETARLNKCKF
jgi:hypothetical protein